MQALYTRHACDETFSSLKKIMARGNFLSSVQLSLTHYMQLVASICDGIRFVSGVYEVTKRSSARSHTIGQGGR